MVRDFEKFGVTYWDDTEEEREKLLSAFNQAYANTAAKVIMNFGKVFTPVAEEWAEIMQDVQVNPQCDETCAIKCMNPMRRETMFFDSRCLASCRCQFRIDKIGHENLRIKAKNLESALNEAERFSIDRQNEIKKAVKPRLDYYLKKTDTLHREFGDLILRHAVETFGCDKDCLADCVENPTLVSFWEIPMCVRHCKCTLKRIVNIEKEPRKNVNLHHVLEEGDYDESGMNFLKEHLHY